MTPWSVAHRIPLSMGFPRQEYWSGLPFPSPRDLPNPEIEPPSQTPVSLIEARRLPSEPPGKLKLLNIYSSSCLVDGLSWEPQTPAPSAITSEPWRRKWQPTPVFLPGESHGQRSLVGYSSWDRKSQTQLSAIFLSFPLFSSCSFLMFTKLALGWCETWTILFPLFHSQGRVLRMLLLLLFKCPLIFPKS